MTHDVVERNVENFGSVMAEYVTIDITSLDGADFEDFAPGTISDPYGVEVVGVAGDYKVDWDHVNERLRVKPGGSHNHPVDADNSGTTANAEFDANGNLNVGNGGSIEAPGEVGSGTAVGEIKLRAEGPR